MKDLKPLFNRSHLAAIAVILLLTGVLSYLFMTPQAVDSQAQGVASQGEDTSYSAYAAIAPQDIQHGGGIFEYAWNVSDPYYFYDTAPVVAVVHIDSIDGGRNYDPVSQQYIYPQTIGTMSVLQVYKGQLEPGQQLNYIRMGGIITYEDYWKGLNPAQRDKMIYLNGGHQPVGKRYVQEKPFDDIDLEVSTDYLVFLRPQSSLDGHRQQYVMDGAQYGLRQVRGSGAEATILNNETGQWDRLASVVRLP